MQRLDGRALGKSCNRALKGKVALLARPPGLAVILVGEDPASEVYVRTKARVASRLGFHHVQTTLPIDTSMDELLATIDAFNADDAIDGILLQLPLPPGLDEGLAVNRVSPEKDVDGFTTMNIGRLARGAPSFVACTPKGVMRLLESLDEPLSGKLAVVVGRSNIVGRPMAMLLEQANCTVLVAHSRTRDLPSLLVQADVVVAAVGRPRMIQGDWLKPGAVVIDVGINRLDDGTLVGDVDDSNIAHVLAATPVPGGVGPMTIAMLMENTFEAARAHQQR
jgi:methylenetetrahydrofolate dehydrogenase (NADP+)/methenyltetrahydrofolate cyclohydrolase